jgi:hypothetical protein
MLFFIATRAPKRVWPAQLEKISVTSFIRWEKVVEFGLTFWENSSTCISKTNPAVAFSRSVYQGRVTDPVALTVAYRHLEDCT